MFDMRSIEIAANKYVMRESRKMGRRVEKFGWPGANKKMRRTSWQVVVIVVVI